MRYAFPELSQLCKKKFQIVGVLIKAGSGSASTERTSEEHSSIEQTGNVHCGTLRKFHAQRNPSFYFSSFSFGSLMCRCWRTATATTRCHTGEFGRRKSFSSHTSNCKYSHLTICCAENVMRAHINSLPIQCSLTLRNRMIYRACHNKCQLTSPVRQHHPNMEQQSAVHSPKLPTVSTQTFCICNLMVLLCPFSLYDRITI